MMHDVSAALGSVGCIYAVANKEVRQRAVLSEESPKARSLYNLIGPFFLLLVEVFTDFSWKSSRTGGAGQAALQH